jgi:L-alanine-DL-glutamate epimerase-like enolase superfamily enzyme
MTDTQTRPAAETALASSRTGTVTAVETTTVSLQASSALAVYGARGSHTGSDFVMVRVHTSEGAVGYGEVSATPRWSGEDAVSATHFLRDVLAPAVIGQPLLPVSALTARMDLSLASNSFTKAGLNMALWDALGRTLGLRVAELLGGPLRTEIPVKMSLSGDGDRLAGALERIRERGFRAFKVKVGISYDTDVPRFALARSLTGDDTFLGADANGGWTRSDALRTSRALAQYQPAFIEQPVRAGDLEGMAAVRSVGIPVLADEAVYSVDDVANIIRLRAADALNVYVGKSGGLELAVREMDIATAFGLDAIIGSNGEFGVGAAAQIHVACAVQRIGPFPSDIIGHHYYDVDILKEPAPIDGRVARLPDGPGLGVEPGAEVIARFA